MSNLGQTVTWSPAAASDNKTLKHSLAGPLSVVSIGLACKEQLHVAKSSAILVTMTSPISNVHSSQAKSQLNTIGSVT